MFAEDGFASVTMRAIAREMECSPAKPYSYFDGKDGIFSATRARCFAVFTDFVEENLDGVEDPEQALRVQATSYVAFARQQPKRFQMMFDLRLPNAEDDPLMREAVRRSWGLLRDGVQRAIDAGVLVGDADALAHLMWSGVHGIAALEHSGAPGPDWDAETLVLPMIDSLIEAHRPDSEHANLHVNE